MENLVPLAMKELGLGLQVAVDYVDKRIQTALDEYVALKAALPSWGAEADEALAKYLAGCEYGVSAFIHYGFNSMRYFGEELEEVKSTFWVTLPPGDISRLEGWLR